MESEVQWIINRNRMKAFNEKGECVADAVLMKSDPLGRMGQILAESATVDNWTWYKSGLRQFVWEHPDFTHMLEHYLDHSEGARQDFPYPMEERIALAASLGLVRDLVNFWADTAPDYLAEGERIANRYLEENPDTEFAKLLRYTFNTQPPQ